MTDWSEYQDDISDAISDGVDIDWNANDGARAVVRWLNEKVSLTASANDALALRAMLDNLVIAQGLSKEIREHATDAARSYLYNTRAMISAAPAPEGRAVDYWRPIDSAPHDGTKIDLWGHWPEHDRWTRTPDAVWDEDRCDWKVNGFYAGQYAHPPRFTHWRAISGPAALATRDASAEAVTADSLRSVPDETMRALLSCKDVGSGRAHLAAIINALRAQPPAREDAQPVSCQSCGGEIQGWVCQGCGLTFCESDGRLIAEHPAPDALREAVEALEPFAKGGHHRTMPGLSPSYTVADFGDGVVVTVADFRRAAEAFAALQAEQKGGA